MSVAVIRHIYISVENRVVEGILIIKMEELAVGKSTRQSSN
jgi:hypothetical protein